VKSSGQLASRSVKPAFRILLLAIVVLAASRFVPDVSAGAQDSDPDLVVHEWGTFTSVAGPSGETMKWSPLTWTNLPEFVEHIGWEGYKSDIRGTVRMETPVLFFYTPHETRVSVNVRFARGLMTEWYPHATVVGHKSFSQETLYDGEPDGTISWNNVLVEPGAPLSLPQSNTRSEYFAARDTSSAPLRVSTTSGDQQEKFLFYRGVSAVPAPIKSEVLPNSSVRISGGSPDVIYFERRGDRVGYRLVHNPGQEAIIEAPDLNGDVDSLSRDLVQTLVSHGLFTDEARAMVNTWRASWFEEGSRLIYIVPATFVDPSLPLKISPRPAELVRVFVGRVELVTPATELGFETALASMDKAEVQKYVRFQEPILETIRRRDPQKGSRMDKLLADYYSTFK